MPSGAFTKRLNQMLTNYSVLSLPHHLRYVRPKRSEKRLQVQSMFLALQTVAAPVYSTFRFQTHHLLILLQAWSPYSFMKPFRVTITKYLFSRKTSAYRPSGASPGMEHSARDGL